VGLLGARSRRFFCRYLGRSGRGGGQALARPAAGWSPAPLPPAGAARPPAGADRCGHRCRQRLAAAVEGSRSGGLWAVFGAACRPVRIATSCVGVTIARGRWQRRRHRRHRCQPRPVRRPVAGGFLPFFRRSGGVGGGGRRCRCRSPACRHRRGCWPPPPGRVRAPAVSATGAGRAPWLPSRGLPWAAGGRSSAPPAAGCVSTRRAWASPSGGARGSAGGSGVTAASPARWGEFRRPPVRGQLRGGGVGAGVARRPGGAGGGCWEPGGGGNVFAVFWRSGGGLGGRRWRGRPPACRRGCCWPPPPGRVRAPAVSATGAGRAPWLPSRGLPWAAGGLSAAPPAAQRVSPSRSGSSPSGGATRGLLRGGRVVAGVAPRPAGAGGAAGRPVVGGFLRRFLGAAGGGAAGAGASRRELVPAAAAGRPARPPAGRCRCCRLPRTAVS